MHTRGSVPPIPSKHVLLLTVIGPESGHEARTGVSAARWSLPRVTNHCSNRLEPPEVNSRLVILAANIHASSPRIPFNIKLSPLPPISPHFYPLILISTDRFHAVTRLILSVSVRDFPSVSAIRSATGYANLVRKGNDRAASQEYPDLPDDATDEERWQRKVSRPSGLRSSPAVTRTIVSYGSFSWWAGRRNAAPDSRNHYIFKVYSTQLHWAPYLMARAMFGFGNVRWHPSCPNFKTHWTATYYENDDLPANWGERRDVEQRLSFEGTNTRMAADRSQACLSGTSRVPQKRSAASLAAGTNTRAKTIKPSPETPTAESTNEVPEEWDMAMKRALEDMSARNTKIAAAMKKNDGPARILATCFFWLDATTPDIECHLPEQKKSTMNHGGTSNVDGDGSKQEAQGFEVVQNY
ncbi:hypothetical protein PCL_12974 [Purpureocillium lilacinum]|uniref:Uncharacterized protein n=1 Tax=Purpureocillium lilacinum TaxID=33203 RepID=A0A2U3E7S0_PURLI|nr:hypothetical protein PCL_12974 [Purpureocillium lilacinum]